MKREFRYLSKDGVTEIHGVEWIPEGKVLGVLQICHGMKEYINRYQEFARYCSSRGFYVVGHDHLGHGLSISKEENHGFFHETDGNEILLEDIHTLQQMAKEQYPNLPYFLMGHSMGSFLVRQYISRYGRSLSGAIIMGSAWKDFISLFCGLGLCKILGMWKGWHYRSRLVEKIAFSGYNRRWKPEKTEFDWLSREEQVVEDYLRDSLCNYAFSVNGYYNLFLSILKSEQSSTIGRMPKWLPLFLVAGAEDPVGGFGKGVYKLEAVYKKAKMKRVFLKLYEGARHEILNEEQRRETYQDIYHWMREMIEG